MAVVPFISRYDGGSPRFAAAAKRILAMQYELGFVGAGNMAEAIARAAVEQQIMSAAQIVVADPVAERRELFKSLGIAVTDRNEDVIGSSTHLLLAVKPQILDQLRGALANIDIDAQIVMTIMAGIRSEKIEQRVGQPARVVRVMPNTPLLVGYGMAGIALGRHARAGDDELALRLFGAAGQAVRVDESMLDAITAVSGSGPAYVFYLAEAMEKAARDLGLTRDARQLVRQTILGAAQLMGQSDLTAAELRRNVTSPGGTTEAAIHHLDANASVEVIINAIKAADTRSRELGV